MSEYPFYHSRIEIDSQALRDNARYLHTNLGSGMSSIAVIKADAYGHGAVDVARLLQDLYDKFAVANVTEAVALRKAGITHPIVIFGVPFPETVKAYTDYDLEAVVSSEEHFEMLEPGTSYHVEIDSGMGRLGFLPASREQVADTLEMVRERIAGRNKIRCVGVMTHFATADEAEFGYLDQQKTVLRMMLDAFSGKVPVHAANSAASLDHPDTHADMVRHGIALYGYDPTPEPSGKLRPAMKWWSRIVQCKPLVKGASLSYGATWQAPEDGYYAVVPTGYADGYRRNLSGEMLVRIADKWYPQVGRVTMDYVMIWLGQDHYPVGTDVLVMGGERNHAGILADAIGTIPYEICCGIHPKVPRIMV